MDINMTLIRFFDTIHLSRTNSTNSKVHIAFTPIAKMVLFDKNIAKLLLPLIYNCAIRIEISHVIKR